MANKVDPFVIKWPDRWISDPEIEPVIRYLNRHLHDSWIRSGGGEDLVDTGNEFNTTNQAAINEINQRLGSGDPLTCDETGFTVDSTRLTVDQTEA